MRSHCSRPPKDPMRLQDNRPTAASSQQQQQPTAAAAATSSSRNQPQPQLRAVETPRGTNALAWTGREAEPGHGNGTPAAGGSIGLDNVCRQKLGKLGKVGKLWEAREAGEAGEMMGAQHAYPALVRSEAVAALRHPDLEISTPAPRRTSNLPPAYPASRASRALQLPTQGCCVGAHRRRTASRPAEGTLCSGRPQR